MKRLLLTFRIFYCYVEMKFIMYPFDRLERNSGQSFN